METQNYQFSYIIPYRHVSDRLPLLRKVIAWLYTIPGAEVIIVEQDTEPKLVETDHRARHYIFSKNDGPFEKGWAYNIGAKYATTDTIVFADADLIMDVNDFKTALSEFKKGEYDVINPYSSVIDLFPQENSIPISNLSSIKRPGRGENDHQKVPLAGGITIWKRSAVDRVGGWPEEEFQGWGCEDNAQEEKIIKLGLKHKTLPYKSYHLYHSRTAPDQNLYMRNLNVLKQIKEMSDVQMIRWINQSVQKIGNKNKYV